MAAPVSAALTNFSPSFPTSGAPGQLINFTGTVGAPSVNTLGLVYWDSTTTQVGTLTVALGATTIGGSFVVPAAATLGFHTITIVFSSTESYGPYAFNVIPTLTIATNTGFVGDQVQVTGTGYAASSSIQLYWDATAFATVSSSATGTIGPVNVTVPDTYRGPHIISNTPTGSGAAAIYTVASKLTASPASVNVGNLITIAGTGFAQGPTNPVSLSIDGTVLTNTINTTATGSFQATFNMPALPYGSHTILAQDSTGSASTTINVTPKISLSSTAGTAVTSAGVGDTLAISGNGFAANETITYKIGNITLTVNPVNLSSSKGVLSDVTFTVPALASGTYTVTVSDAEQHSATASFTISANIAITPTGGPVGTQIAVTGNGFAPGAPVSITWENSTTPIVTTTASATGTITVTFAAPTSGRGPHTVKASDTSGSSAQVSFTISSKITLTPTSGGYGDTITITFSGFAANAPISGVKMISGSTSYDLATVPASIQTDPFGSITAKFTVPSVPNGTWVIQATDAGGSAQANLAVTQKLTVNPISGSAGDMIAVIGTGFKASTGIDLKYNGTTVTVAAGISTDVNGSFQTSFAVPKTVAGVMPVTASDGTNTASASFTATAKATISKVTNQTTPGFVGQDITVTGTGFAVGVITVTFESTPQTVAIVSADSTGSFTASFKVPTAPSGPHTIHVSDGTTIKDFSYFMDSTPPDAPKLVLPVDKFKPKQPIPFTWGAVTDPSGATYTLQISQDPSFATVILEKTGLTTAGYTMSTAEKLKSAGAKTPYYWRVKATDLAGNVGAWSTSNTFTIGFMWPSWIIYVWGGLAIIVALILGLWIGRRMAFQSY